MTVLIFIEARALAGSCARKKRQALPDFLKGLNLIETSVMNFVIIETSRMESLLCNRITRLIEAHKKCLGYIHESGRSAEAPEVALCTSSTRFSVLRGVVSCRVQ